MGIEFGAASGETLRVLDRETMSLVLSKGEARRLERQLQHGCKLLTSD